MDEQIASIIPHKGRIITNKEELVIHYRINLKHVCLWAVSIPLVALVVCLVSSYIFQYDDVHETHCRVFNIVPSISAVTGVSPQRYIWRISVALHIGPRVIISAVYNAYQLSMINPLADQDVKFKAQIWLNLAYVLNLIEAASLCGVAYISNRENYAIHEKLFITFMVSSLTHMLACIQGTKIAAETRNDFESIKDGLKYKKDLLVLSLLCTAGLVIFFLQHRFFCFRMGPTHENNHKHIPIDPKCDQLYHGHAIQKAYYDKYYIFKLLKSFPFDIFTSVKNISTDCRKEYKIHLDGVLRNELNSLKLFDATAKPGAGLLSGNINQYGDFDECMEVPDAQYCLVLMDLDPVWKMPLSRYKDLVHSHYSIKETFEDPAHRVPGFTFVRWGFCLPKGCMDDDLTTALAHKLGVKAKIRSNMCQVANLSTGKSLSHGDYFARGYFIFIMLMVGVSTLVYRKIGDGNIWSKLIISFAIQRNYKQLTTLSKNEKEYYSVHGVRCLSAISLLMAHKTMASLYNPYINRTWMVEIQAMKWSVLGRNAIIYTDCFLLISGLLNANALFAELEKYQKINFKEKLMGRLFRILPGVMTVVLFSTYILPFLGSGPLWPIVINHHSELCKKHMWRNFLFVHNYYGFEEMCLTHTHQLGIDMQLFLVTPIFVYVLWKWRVLGLWTVGVIAISSMFLRFYNTFFYSLSHVVHFGIPISRMFDTADYSYILPTHRATIYFIGVVLAWYLRSPIKISFSKKKLFFIWILIYMIGFTTWFAPVTMSVKGYEYNNLEAALYGAIYPFTWGYAVAWVIYATENGFGSWFALVLTWKYFQIFTKIAYGVYLIQFPVFFYNVGVTRHAGQFKNYMMLPPVEITIILLLSTLLTLFVEMPFQNISKIICSKKKNDK